MKATFCIRKEDGRASVYPCRARRRSLWGKPRPVLMDDRDVIEKVILGCRINREHVHCGGHGSLKRGQ